ncbi:MAG: hypothetical protein J6V11_00765, partial [Alphaproteobacteria bacterium]|nr:hypothetical protein [Alphaproteobacteria bacterium]
GSLAFSSQMSYQDEYSNSAIHLETKLDKIALNKMLIPLPEIFLPTEVSLNIDIKNIQKENLNILFNQDETISQAERQLALKNIMSTAFVQLNQLNVKNADAGISVSGKLYNQKNNIGLPQPQADLTVVITNLDKISPEPKVDEKYCEETKEFFADKSPFDKEAAEAIQAACTPRGGFFDMWRSYLDPEKRVVNSNGTITDTLSVVLKNNVLVINGQEIQWNQMNY